jgi:GNAT superfamily N-acetyltransferase
MTFNHDLADTLQRRMEPGISKDPDNDVIYFLRERGSFVISTDPMALNIEAVFEFLADAKWWPNLTRESLKLALDHSLCFSLREEDRQIGFARLITDFVTYAYLCDVYIVEERRGRGLGSWLIDSILEHPDLKSLKRIALITHNSQSFYLRHHFSFLPDCSCYMELVRPGSPSSAYPK